MNLFAGDQLTQERLRNAKIALASGKFTFSAAEQTVQEGDGGFHLDMALHDVSKWTCGFRNTLLNNKYIVIWHMWFLLYISVQLKFVSMVTFIFNYLGDNGQGEQ